MTNLEICTFDNIPRNWDEFVNLARNSSVMHTRDFLEFLQRIGYAPKIICIMNEDRILASLLLISYKKLGFKIYSYYPLGAYDSLIFIDKYNYKIIKKMLLDYLIKNIKSTSILIVKLGDWSSNFREHYAYLIRNDFLREVENTYILKLDNPDKIWKNLNKKARNNIRKAEKYLIVEEINKKSQVKELYPLFVKTAKKHGNKCHKIDYYLNILKAKNVLWFATKLERDDCYTSTCIFWFYKNKIIYGDNAMDYQYKSYYGTDLIIWSVIKLCYDKFKIMDMGGVPPNNYGLQHFKEKWGAVRKDYFSYTYRSPIFNLVHKFEYLIRKFIRIDLRG